jgi:hypothetical protein
VVTESGYSGEYHDALLSVKSYSSTENELKFFYGDSDNYLLYTPEKTDSIITNLKGTKWKLAYAIDIVTGKVKEFEPKHCEECYTLTFETDLRAVFFSINKSGYIDLLNLLDLPDGFFNRMLICVRYFKDSVSYCDSDDFRNGVISTLSYTITSDELTIYPLYARYNLLFKLLKTTEQ